MPGIAGATVFRRGSTTRAAEGRLGVMRRANRKRKKQAHDCHDPICEQKSMSSNRVPNSVLPTKLRVPHISLVFREMWDTTILSLGPYLSKQNWRVDALLSGPVTNS
jgi:hypothetical protein